MRHRVVLPNRNILVRVLENRATIMVHIKIVRSGEDGVMTEGKFFFGVLRCMVYLYPFQRYINDKRRL